MLNFRSKVFCNFFLYRVLQTLNFSVEVSGHQIFLVMLNLRSKIFRNFSIYKALWTLNFFIEDEFCLPHFLGHTKLEVQSFWDFFHLQNILDSEFLRGDVWAPIFFWSH